MIIIHNLFLTISISDYVFICISTCTHFYLHHLRIIACFLASKCYFLPPINKLVPFALHSKTLMLIKGQMEAAIHLS